MVVVTVATKQIQAALAHLVGGIRGLHLLDLLHQSLDLRRALELLGHRVIADDWRGVTHWHLGKNVHAINQPSTMHKLLKSESIIIVVIIMIIIFITTINIYKTYNATML